MRVRLFLENYKTNQVVGCAWASLGLLQILGEDTQRCAQVKRICDEDNVDLGRILSANLTCCGDVCAGGGSSERGEQQQQHLTTHAVILCGDLAVLLSEKVGLQIAPDVALGNVDGHVVYRIVRAVINCRKFGEGGERRMEKEGKDTVVLIWLENIGEKFDPKFGICDVISEFKQVCGM